MNRLLPSEILNEIFEHFGYKEIYSCLFVNHKFYTHAIPFLHRKIDFKLYPPTKKIKFQNLLWTQLYNQSELLLHIRYLDVDFRLDCHYEKPESAFSPSDFQYILHHALGLKTIKLSFDMYTKIANEILPMLAESG